MVSLPNIFWVSVRIQHQFGRCRTCARRDRVCPAGKNTAHVPVEAVPVTNRPGVLPARPPPHSHMSDHTTTVGTHQTHEDHQQKLFHNPNLIWTNRYQAKHHLNLVA